MKVSEKAYTAGILDGEGSISAYEAGYDGNLTLRVTVVQRQDRIAMLEFLKDHWGGFIGGHDKSNGRNNTASWVVLAGNAKKMLLKVHPFLILKKGQAELAIAFQVMRERVTAWRLSTGQKGKCHPLPEDYLTTTSLVKNMFTAMNSKWPNITPVAETERENLIRLCKVLPEIIGVPIYIQVEQIDQDATVQTVQIENVQI